MIIAVFIVAGKNHPSGTAYYSKSNLQVKNKLSPKMLKACEAKCYKIADKCSDKWRCSSKTGVDRDVCEQGCAQHSLECQMANCWPRPQWGVPKGNT